MTVFFNCLNVHTKVDLFCNDKTYKYAMHNQKTTQFVTYGKGDGDDNGWWFLMTVESDMW